MGLNNTPRSERVHIAIFGRRNAGKSSLINAITEQQVATVSSIKGTTTDPVYKAMEILPLGPVVIIDTAGLDDHGELGELRKEKTFGILNKTDLAIVVIDVEAGLTDLDKDILIRIHEKKIPIIVAANKIDKYFIIDDKEPMVDPKDSRAGRELREGARDLKEGVIDELKETLMMWIREQSGLKNINIPCVPVSAEKGIGIEELKKSMVQAAKLKDTEKKIIADLLQPKDMVVLVIPLDEAAPKGRLILPQQQVIRELLDQDIVAIATREYTLPHVLKNMGGEVRLVITDSQIFREVAKIVPSHIPLTSFSILFARYKGDLQELVKGANSIGDLENGDKVLVVEACTHHKMDEDIGRVKIPRWLGERTGKKLEFEFAGGGDFPENIDKYSLIIHCGACMLNPRAMEYRIKRAKESGRPIVNYGILIAYLQGILDRVIQPLI